MFFHLALSNVQSDHYSLNCCKKRLISVWFRSNSTNGNRIPNWRIGGETVSKTASFMYISYCDTITTQMINRSQSSEFAKSRLCCTINPDIRPRVYDRSGLQPCQDSAVWIFEWVWKQTQTFFDSKPGPLAGYPDQLVTLIPSQLLGLEFALFFLCCLTPTPSAYFSFPPSTPHLTLIIPQ